MNVLFIKTLEESHLDAYTADSLKRLLWEHQDTFAKNSTDLGFCQLLKHDIDTGDSPPIKQSPRRPPLAAREAEDQIFSCSSGRECQEQSQTNCPCRQVDAMSSSC